LAAASWETLTPERSAIAESVSPGWTTYPPEPELRPLAATAPELAAVELEPRGVTPTALPCGGIWRTEPVTSPESGEMPLAAASSETLKPSAAATELSDSPEVTVWGNAANAAAGVTNIAAARVEQIVRRRMARSFLLSTLL
jgi:hypothetical protein